MPARDRAQERRGPEGEKGAVAVEFALLMPVFLMLVLGIFEFGRGFNIQVSLSEAARESARYAAVRYAETGFTKEKAQEAGRAAAPSVPLAAGDVNITYEYADGSVAPSCGPNIRVVSKVSYATGFLTGLDQMIGAAQPYTVIGKGVMRCGG